MNTDGFLPLNRKLTDWRWYTEPATCHLFVTLLYMANHTDNEWHDTVIKRGSCITSIGSLMQKTGLSAQQIRTAIKHLISTNDITKQSTNKNTLIIVTNYDYWVLDNKESNNRLTNLQQTTNNKQKLKNNKNEKNIIKDIVRYLNEKAGTAYKDSSQKTQRCINARLSEGYRIEDFKKVIDTKCDEWLGDDKMQKYLRPETLFGTKFESYLNQKPKQKILDKQADDYIDF